jgi:hypothetical protein
VSADPCSLDIATPYGVKRNGARRAGSRSPSLTPPPPPSEARPRANLDAASTSPERGKRKRDNDGKAGLDGAIPTYASSDSAGLIGGEPVALIGTDEPMEDAGPQGDDQLMLGSASDEAKEAADLEGSEGSHMPENIQGPDAEQAFLEAMEAFDEQDLDESAEEQEAGADKLVESRVKDGSDFEMTGERPAEAEAEAGSRQEEGDLGGAEPVTQTVENAGNASNRHSADTPQPEEAPLAADVTSEYNM